MNTRVIVLLSILIFLLAACSVTPQTTINYDPATLRFDGQRAYTIENEFVTKFPYRASGMPNNRLAAAWLQEQFIRSGWTCTIDEWTVINYSKPVPLRNVVCRLPGTSSREIVVVAHHDQSPLTVQGADNDGSGIAILLHLGEIFGSEEKLPYTLVFVASDGEEYGMLGSKRFVDTHPDPSYMIAGFSLDQLGKGFFNGLDMDARGQFSKIGQLWLQLLTVDSARAAGLWPAKVRAPLDQVTDQAVPISFMDEGPLVSAGVPAIGLTGLKPVRYAALHWQIYHSPLDTMEYQSSEALYQFGRMTEAVIRQLMTMTSFPSESGPYLYFENSRQVLRGAPLWSIFIGLVALFFLGAIFAGGVDLKDKISQWRSVMPHFLGLWLPLVASISLLYLFVAVGLMDKYALYPATTKDPETLNPHWPAVILFLAGLVVFLWLGRQIARSLGKKLPAPQPGAIKSFALFIVGLAAVFVLATNPFSLLFFIPLLFWLLIGVREGAGRWLDILFLISGGAIVYILIYMLGFVIQQMGFAVFWYILLMFSIGMVGFLTVLATTAILAAGLTMVVRSPVRMV
ncbi:MAG: M28 family peptidase [Omnitrophica WOR_2 bacterium]